MTAATLAASLLTARTTAAQSRSPILSAALRWGGTWLGLALCLALVLAGAGRTFGIQHRSEGARAADAVNLDAAGRASLVRLDQVRQDLLLIGSTSALVGQRSGDGPATGSEEAAAADLQQFVVTKDWCLGIGLASARRAVTAERDGRSLGCDPLFAVVAALTPGTLVLDRADVRGEPRLCVGLALDAPVASAALVAEADPALLFPELGPRSPDGPTYLADGNGRWLIGPPPEVPLLRRALALSSWQGPAGGRWEVARTASPVAVLAPVGTISRSEQAGTIALVAALVALAFRSALEARRRAGLWKFAVERTRG